MKKFTFVSRLVFPVLLVVGMLFTNASTALAASLFLDNFDQNGSGMDNGWDILNDSPSRTGTNAVSGKALNFKGGNGSDDSAERRIATKGYNSLPITYKVRSTSLDSGENLTVQFYLDDVLVDTDTYSSITTNQTISVDQSKIISNQDRHTKLTIRITVSASDSSDVAGIDDLVVSGNNPPLFYDGFESNNFTTGGWITSESPDITDTNGDFWTDNNDSLHGHAANIDGSSNSNPDDAIVKSFSTTGLENIKVRYARKAESLSSGETFEAQYLIDSSTWTNLETPSGNSSYQSVLVSLPSTADNNSNFKIRFQINGSSPGDNLFIDDVIIWGDVIVVKTNPTLSVTNSPQTYNGSPQSATVTGSVSGVVSDVKYNGSGTAPTNAGTYAVIADFVPADTTNYNSLNDASAGNFVINKANATIIVTPYDVIYDDNSHTATGTAKGVLNEDLVGLDLSGTTHTVVGTYNSDAWIFTDVTGNYNDTSGTVNNLINEVPVTTATIVAAKIVCPTEDLLPNWGAGGLDITSTTVSDFLEQNTSCYQSEWTFEWAPNGTNNPGDNVGIAGGAWTPFSGSATIPAGALVWLREQVNNNYIPFSSDTSEPRDQNISAEFYCNTDVLNYDNFDFIDPVVAGQTYNCVGFNTLKPVPVDGGWTPWSEKSNSCGASGTQTRSCTNPSPANGGADCSALDGGNSSQSYTNDSCPPGPIDGGWSDWTPINENACGTVVEQTRSCTNPAPVNGGLACVGESTQTITNSACPVNGGWTPWSEKSNSCGASGTQTRSCTNPSPANGGADCQGPFEQSYINSACLSPGPQGGGGLVEQPPAQNPPSGNEGSDPLNNSGGSILNNIGNSEALGEQTGGEVLGEQTFQFTRTLRLGMKGDDVLELHKKLTELGFYKGPIDDIFGRLLRAAVKAFQKANPPLKVDGVVGPATRAILNK